MYMGLYQRRADTNEAPHYSHHLISGASALSKVKVGNVSVLTESPYIYRLGPTWGNCCCYWECCCYSLTVVSHSGQII